MSRTEWRCQNCRNAVYVRKDDTFGIGPIWLCMASDDYSEVEKYHWFHKWETNEEKEEDNDDD